MPVKGRNQTISMREIVVLAVVMTILAGATLVAFGVESFQWTMPVADRTSSAGYVVSISSNMTSLNFTNGAIGWWALDLVHSPSAVVQIRIEVFVNMTDGTYFQLAEYYPEGEEWVSEDMQDVGEKTWASSVTINEGETKQFAIWIIGSDGERRGTSCRFYLQSIGGKIVVGPV